MAKLVPSLGNARVVSEVSANVTASAGAETRWNCTDLTELPEKAALWQRECGGGSRLCISKSLQNKHYTFLQHPRNPHSRC